jgi:hypothetical protein
LQLPVGPERDAAISVRAGQAGRRIGTTVPQLIYCSDTALSEDLPAVTATRARAVPAVTQCPAT